MKISTPQLTGIFLTLLSINATATVRYVDLNCPNPTPPFTDWSTAATSIQDAVDAASAGDKIIVTNGVYQTGGRFASGTSTSNRVAVTKTITVQSVNGPAVTMIRGYQVPGATNGVAAIRCVYLITGSALFGFTLTNGATISTSDNGGGVWCQSSSATVSNCVLIGNAARTGGGGGYSGTYKNCFVTGNWAPNGGGISSGTLNNCLMTSNSAPSNGGGTYLGTLNNCTLAGNYALTAGGGAYGGTLNNCISYFNAIGSFSPTGTNASSATINYCCIPVIGNVTSAPRFVSLAGGDLRLASNSPCINMGNNAFAPAGRDLNGDPRIVGVFVDLGAYEFQVPASTPVHYVVSKNTNAAPPYGTWQTAATNIQNAIDFAAAGELIVVSNGNYQTGGRVMFGAMTNRVAVTKALTLQSLNGPDVTTITGNPVLNGNAVRCVYLTNGATLAGFTLANGGTSTNGDVYKEQSGGGVWCAAATATVSNCVIAGSRANNNGGGAYLGKLYNCILSNNFASSGGGAFSNALYNCILVTNRAGVYGGGSYMATLTSCVLSNNFSIYGGGGSGGTFNSCLLAWNTSFGYGLGGGAYSANLNNCLVYFNNRNPPAISGGGAAFSALNNCTVVRNGNPSPALQGGGTYYCAITNSIIYNNNGAGPSANDYGSTMSYCCTSPLLGFGVGNFTSAPVFADSILHLETNSPCINAGLDAAAPGGTDYDGRQRIVDGTVDVGAQEYQGDDFEPFVLWLYQYGMLNDGSADFTDTDSDGLNNWQEWIAGTIPTNSLSVLTMFSPSNNAPSLIVSWQSVSGKIYFLQRATDLAAQPAFSALQSNIVGQGGTTTYTDTTATNGGPYFYRVGVQ